MEPKLRLDKFAEVDRNAELQRQGVQYIINLIESDEDRFAAAFVPADTPPEKRDATLYSQTEKMIRSLIANHTRSIGITVYTFDPEKPETNLPSVQVGWERMQELAGSYGSDNGGSSRGCRVLTDYGRDILDGYRSAIGKITTVQEARAQAHADLDLAIDMAHSSTVE